MLSRRSRCGHRLARFGVHTAGEIVVLLPLRRPSTNRRCLCTKETAPQLEKSEGWLRPPWRSRGGDQGGKQRARRNKLAHLFFHTCSPRLGHLSHFATPSTPFSPPPPSLSFLPVVLNTQNHGATCFVGGVGPLRCPGAGIVHLLPGRQLPDRCVLPALRNLCHGGLWSADRLSAERHGVLPSASPGVNVGRRHGRGW